MKKAKLKDLEMEKWFRERNSGELVWVTKDGTQIPLKDIEDQHLDNILNILRSIRANLDLIDLYDPE